MKIKAYKIKGKPKPSKVKRPLIIQEYKSVFTPLSLLSSYKKLTKTKIGNQQKVMLFPGWMSPELSMYPMKNFLQKLGFNASYWDLGINYGKIEAYRDEIVSRLKSEPSKEKVTLIGWSLGGVVAREVARTMPEKISSVITYGTPIVGGPKYTIGAKFWDKKETKRISKLIKQMDKTNPLKVPISIVFTKNDSFVSWEACLDKKSKNVKHYEVKSTHLSLGIDPKVWQIVAHHMEEYLNE